METRKNRTNEYNKRTSNLRQNEITKKRMQHRSAHWKVAILNNSKFQYPIYFDNFPMQIHDDPHKALYEYVPCDVELPTSSKLLEIFHYSQNLLISNHLDQCISFGNSKSCKYAPGLKVRIGKTCCGFIAPVLGVILHFIDLEYKGHPFLQTIHYKYNDVVNAALNFYTKYTGYGNSSNSWNYNCNKWSKILKDGVNIMTIYDREELNPDSTTCQTYHHFIVFKENEYCIIIDSWAGSGGRRGPWVRIMYESHLIQILNAIATTTDLIITNELLNQYFIVPHSININQNPNSAVNIQQQLVSIGAYNLVDWNEELKHLLKSESFERSGSESISI
jgi:hypothetical protein